MESPSSDARFYGRDVGEIMDEKSDYREGCDEEASEEESSEEETPQTAILLCLMDDGRVTVSTEAGEDFAKRTASLADIRNMGLIASRDAEIHMMARQASITMTQSLQQAVVQHRAKPQIIVPGHGPGKRGGGHRR